MSSTNPRKFAEKIANIQRKAEEEREKFDSIMNDVQRLTKKTPSQNSASDGKTPSSSAANDVSCQPGPSGCNSQQQQQQQQQQGLTIPATGWRGGSLPNVHEMVHPHTQHSTQPIHIQTTAQSGWSAAGTSSWQDGAGSEYARAMHHQPRGRSPGASHYHPYQSPRGYSPTGTSQSYRPSSRERLHSQSTAVGGYTMGQHHGQPVLYPAAHPGQFIPLPAGQFLQLPDQSGAWRRTHSDPGIHQSIVGQPVVSSGAPNRSPVGLTQSTGPLVGQCHSQQSHTPTTARSSIGSNDSPLTDMSSPPQSHGMDQAHEHSHHMQQMDGSHLGSHPTTTAAGGSLPDLPNTPNRQHHPPPSQSAMPQIPNSAYTMGAYAAMAAAQQRHSIQLPVAPMQQQHQLQAATPPLYAPQQSSNEHSPSASEPNSPAVMNTNQPQQYDNLNQQFKNISMSAADWAAIGQLQKSAYQHQMGTMYTASPSAAAPPTSSAESTAPPEPEQTQPMDMTKSVSTESPGAVNVPNIILTDAHGNQAAQQQAVLSLDMFSDIERNIDESDLQRLLNEQGIDADSERQLRLE